MIMVDRNGLIRSHIINIQEFMSPSSNAGTSSIVFSHRLWFFEKINVSFINDSIILLFEFL